LKNQQYPIVPVPVSLNHNKRKKQMLKEYFIVGRYIANIPASKDISSFILAQVEEDLKGISPNALKGYLDGLFNVIEGEEIDIEDEEDE